MKTFNNYHLAVTKESYYKHLRLNDYSFDSAGFEVREIEPQLRPFLDLITKYGGDWRWEKRTKYHKHNQNLAQRLCDKETRLFLLLKQGAEIGYCLISSPKKFNASHIIEIENIALSKKETGKGYGKHFIHLLFSDLFCQYQTVYLSTRSTNHSGVVPFYQRMGMSLIKVDKNLPDETRDQRKFPFWESFRPKGKAKVFVNTVVS